MPLGDAIARSMTAGDARPPQQPISIGSTSETSVPAGGTLGPPRPISIGSTSETSVPAGGTSGPPRPTVGNGMEASTSLVGDVSDDDFDAAVLGADIPVLVDFWAPWCGPCLLVGPVLAELAVELRGRLRVVRVNVDENVGISTGQAVFSIPTLVLFKGGREVERMVGFRRKDELASRLRRHLDA